jgi:hypothetical protein
MKEITINYKGIELLIEGTYTPGEEEVRYFSDMLGHPGYPASFDVNAIFVQDVDIYELLSEDNLREIETLILEKICG